MANVTYNIEFLTYLIFKIKHGKKIKKQKTKLKNQFKLTFLRSKNKI